MRNRVVINSGDNDVRVAFLEDSNLVEFHIENLLDRTIVGNIYRGVVQDVIPGLQAAFVDVGMERNVFLHFMDIRPESLVFLEDDLEAAMEEAGNTSMPGRIQMRGRRPRPDPSVKDAPPPVKKGDTIIVQVVKDEISAKAPRATANMTLAGRYLVLLPFPSQQGGVSRRVALGQERMKLKKLLADLRTDQYSFIVRTAGLGVEEEQIRSDVELLTSEWKGLVDRFRSMKGPGLVYSDHDIVNRLVRDAFSANIDEVVVDDSEMAEALRATLDRALPELVDKVIDYDGREPVFTTYQVDSQLEKALSRKVWMKSGGYLIIDEAEALTAIDVNSGRFTGSKDQEKTSVRTNMEACEAIAQQIRLRDIGGIIVIDFIDMLSREHQQRVADELKHQMRHDRAKYTIGRLGDFGLMMMTRKRKHQSLQKQVYDPCPYCKGEGRILSPDEVWRRIRRDLESVAADQPKLASILLCASPNLLSRLGEEFSPFLEAFTQRSGLEVILRGDSALHMEDYTLTPIRKPERDLPHLPAVRIVEDDIVRPLLPYDKRPAAVDLRASASRSSAAPAVERQSGGRSSGRPATVVPVTPAAARPAGPPRADDATPEGEEDGRRRTRRGRRGGRRRRGGETPVEVVVDSLNQTPEDSGVDQDKTPVSGLFTEDFELEEGVLREAVNYMVDDEGGTRARRDEIKTLREEAAAKVEEGARVPAGDRRRQPRPMHRIRPEGVAPEAATAAPEPKAAPAAASAPAGKPVGLTGRVRIVNNWGSAGASPIVKKARKASPFALATAKAPEKPHVPTARKITLIGTWGVSPHPATSPAIDREEAIAGPADPAGISAGSAPAERDESARSQGRRGRGRSRGGAPKTETAKVEAARPEAPKAAAPQTAPARVEVKKPDPTVKKTAARPAARETAKAVAPAKAKAEPAKVVSAAKSAPTKAATTKAAPKKVAAKSVAPKSAATKGASAPKAAPKKAAPVKAAAAKAIPAKAAPAKSAAPKKAAAKKATKKAAMK